MRTPRYDETDIGCELPALVMPPLTRQNLAIYCGASGDHNPVHVDSDFARASGLGDVIAHGMLIMAYCGRMLGQWVPQASIKAFDTRFLAMTRVGDAITIEAKVIEKLAAVDGRCVRVAITARDQYGEAKTSGSAVVELE
jgi:acyl dehydratase